MRIALEWAPAAHLGASLPEGEDIQAPELPDWLIPVWRAWHRMSLDRPYLGGGMGPLVPGRIPWRDIRAWADHHDMTADGFDFLDHCIREMDNEYLEFTAGRSCPSTPDAPIAVDEKIARATAKLETKG